jgi:hypothetical protein
MPAVIAVVPQPVFALHAIVPVTASEFALEILAVSVTAAPAIDGFKPDVTVVVVNAGVQPRTKFATFNVPMPVEKSHPVFVG